MDNVFEAMAFLNSAKYQNSEAQSMAMFVASVVRNSMEEYHVKHLTDEQMAELNPVIRNAIYTALTALNQQAECDEARAYVAFHTRSIPHYWEAPVLLAEFDD